MESAQIESFRKGAYYTLRVQTRPGEIEDWEGCQLDGVVNVGFTDSEAKQEYVKFELMAAAPASMLLEPHRIVEIISED
jgi:hypothetical protein